MVRRLEVQEEDIRGTELGEDDRNLIDRAIEVLRRPQDESRVTYQEGGGGMIPARHERFCQHALQ